MRPSQNMPAQNPFMDGVHIWLNPDMAIMNPGMTIQRPHADHTTQRILRSIRNGAQMHMINIGESYENIALKMYVNAESA